MFRVVDVRHPFLIWVSVELRAEADMTMTDKKLKFGRGFSPAIEWRVLQVKAGETFTIGARRSEGYRVGDAVPLERVVRKLPISLRWRVVSAL